jgi:L-threonylcarbamoyladenylate synthase
VARALLTAFGGAIAAPSANRFGRVSTTTAAHVVAELADVLDPTIDRILDGGPCDVGVESTIVDCTGERPRLLRTGQVTVEQVEATTGLSVEADRGVNPAPGTLAAHYAPDAQVVLTDGDGVDARLAAIAADRPDARVGLLARDVVADRPGVLRLAAPHDAEAYARVLFAALRAADDAELDVVLAVPPPDEGVGSAVADRLRRAAHGTMAS